MDSTYKAYDHVASFDRIDGILAQLQRNYEEVNSLTDRDRLTFTNGFAPTARRSSGIRDSSKLPPLPTSRPGEAVPGRPIGAGGDLQRPGQHPEINIAGDAAWAVVNKPYKARRRRRVRAGLPGQLSDQGAQLQAPHGGLRPPLRVGIGTSWGRALMNSGSGVNDVVYMGESSTRRPTSPPRATLDISSPRSWCPMASTAT